MQFQKSKSINLSCTCCSTMQHYNGNSTLNPVIMKNSLFHYCQAVLDQYQVTIEEMETRRAEMKKEYAGSSTVNYKDSVTQCAYIKFDVALHASSIAFLISSRPYISQLFNQPKVDIVSMGCGPGSDMLGILHYLFQSPYQRPYVRFLLTDAISAWEKAIDLFDLFIKINNPYPIGPLYDKFFFPSNISKGPLTYTPMYGSSDIFIFSMILSEIIKGANSKEIRHTKENLYRLCAGAKRGALFLIIDINCTWLNAVVNKLEDTIFKFFTNMVFKINGEFKIIHSMQDKLYAQQPDFCKGNWQPKAKSNLIACMYRRT